VSSLSIILGVAVVMSLIAAVASAFRGGKYVHVDEESKAQRHLARGGRHHAPVASAPAPAVGSAPAAASGTALAAGSPGAARSGAVPAEPQPIPGKWGR
jgi:hypothetical protein